MSDSSEAIVGGHYHLIKEGESYTVVYPSLKDKRKFKTKKAAVYFFNLQNESSRKQKNIMYVHREDGMIIDIIRPEIKRVR